MPELAHNLNILVDMAEEDIIQNDRKQVIIYSGWVKWVFKFQSKSLIDIQTSPAMSEVVYDTGL